MAFFLPKVYVKSYIKDFENIKGMSCDGGFSCLGGHGFEEDGWTKLSLLIILRSDTPPLDALNPRMERKAELQYIGR